MERTFTAPNGRIWIVRPRPYVRKDEAGRRVTLELVAENEVRIVSCAKEEWFTDEPDVVALLDRSVASGAGRSVISQGGGSPR